MNENELLVFVVSAALKGSAILAIAGAITLAWRSASAASRHLVWTAAVISALMLPLISGLLKSLEAPAIEIPAWTPAALVAPRADAPAVQPLQQSVPKVAALTPRDNLSAIDDAADADLPSPEGYTVQAPPVMAAEKRDPATTVPLEWIWLAGLIASLIPLVTATIRIRVIARRSRPARDERWRQLISSTPSIRHLEGRIQILESDSTAMPMTWGLFTPRLLVPTNTSHWPEWKRRDVLLHELAHVERHDCLTQLIAAIACAVYWFNPLAWVAAHRMRIEREHACDDRVIAAGSRASDYAASLLDVARSLRAPSLTSSTAIAMARPSQLSGRLLAVLDSRRNRQSVTRRIAVTASAAAIALALPLAALTPRAQAAAPGEAPTRTLAAPGETAPPAAVGMPAPAFSNVVTGVIAAAQFPSVSLAFSSGESTPAIPALPSSPELPVLAQTPACWAEGDGNTSVSINSDDDKRGGRPSYTVRYSRDNCSLEMRAEGKFTLRADLSDLETLDNDGWFRVEERIGRSSRRVEIRHASNGSLEHQYWVNGDRAAYNESARTWLSRTLLGVERRTAFAASTRVPQLYRTSGLRGVLAEIAQMSGAYAKSRYYSTLLDMGISLDAGTLNSIVGQASTDLSSSDYYMSEVLGRFASQPAANETTWRLFSEAAGRMKSDYYKSVVLKRVLSKGRLSSPNVGMLLRAASGMKSDYYLTDLLKDVSSQYALNADTRQYYAEALRHIESDYYRTELLSAMGSEGEWDAKTSSYVLASVADIKSDYYRSESLVKLLRANHVSDWSSFFNATAGIDSDYYKKTTLTAALRRTPLTREIVAGVLNVVPRMKSDSEMSDVLTVVARNYRIDDGLRTAYEKAVDAMDSEYYRGAALSALRRSETR